MKKTLLNSLAVLALVFTINSNLNAQYQKGDKLLNVGIGLNSGYGSYGGLPLGASFEVGVTDEISAGGGFNYYSYGGAYGFNIMYISARGSYHVNKLLNLNNDKIDLYGGLGLGYQKYSWKEDYGIGYNSNNSRLFFNGFIGGRYYFKPKIAGFAELGGGGASNATIGLTFKF